MSSLVVVALVLRILVNPLANVFQKQLTKNKISPLYINFTTYFLLSIFCLFIAFNQDWSILSGQFLLFALICGLLGALGNGLLIKAFEKGDLSILGPVNAYKSVIGLIFGIIILGEMPGIWGVLGVVLIICGSYFVLDTTKERFTWKLLKNREIQYRIGAMVLAAIEAVFLKKIILLSSVEISFIIWCWFGAIFSFVLMKLFKIKPEEEIVKIDRDNAFKFIYLVACIGIMQYTTNYVFDHMVVGYALSLFQLSVIISIFFGYKFFNESDIKKKLLGSLIMIVGSVFIILMNS